MNARRAIGAAALLLGGSAFLFARPDIPSLYRPRTGHAPPQLPPGQTIPVLPDLTPTAGPQDAQAAGKPDRLRPMSRLALVRYISGEFARAVRALPGLKKGYRVRAGEPVNEQTHRQAVRQGGAAANPGDTVQVTRIEFREKEIVLDINGGSKERKRWRDRIQISVGGPAIPQTRTTTTDTATAGFQRSGATLIVDFGKPVPEMTPGEFKQALAAYLDFSKQRSASVHWYETLPPEFQQAIKEKRALVGMDREMVVAAMGRPDKKVRERDPEGLETEDWIYGHPPGKTIFVKFAGDRVVAVREFPR